MTYTTNDRSKSRRDHSDFGLSHPSYERLAWTTPIVYA